MTFKELAEQEAATLFDDSTFCHDTKVALDQLSVEKGGGGTGVQRRHSSNGEGAEPFLLVFIAAKSK